MSDFDLADMIVGNRVYEKLLSKGAIGDNLCLCQTRIRLVKSSNDLIPTIRSLGNPACEHVRASTTLATTCLMCKL